MSRTFSVAGVAFFALMFIACGSGSRQPVESDWDFPSPGSTIKVQGIYMDDAGAMAADKMDLADFAENMNGSPDVSRNMILQGKVRRIANGDRVEIRFVREEYEIVNVKVLDGKHAGEIGFMDARECGATKKAPASAQKKTKP